MEKSDLVKSNYDWKIISSYKECYDDESPYCGNIEYCGNVNITNKIKSKYSKNELLNILGALFRFTRDFRRTRHYQICKSSITKEVVFINSDFVKNIGEYDDTKNFTLMTEEEFRVINQMDW